jgi:hypothetical protein
MFLIDAWPINFDILGATKEGQPDSGGGEVRSFV